MYIRIENINITFAKIINILEISLNADTRGICYFSKIINFITSYAFIGI